MKKSFSAMLGIVFADYILYMEYGVPPVFTFSGNFKADSHRIDSLMIIFAVTQKGKF
jgi:hypothetical protein